MEIPTGAHDVIPPDEGDPMPRPVLDPLGDDEDDIEPIAAESDDEWGKDDDEYVDQEDDQ